ncbi:MAG: porin family protein [Gammaproteobacteria bacterium]|jgi:opacity protein-like surface antigen
MNIKLILIALVGSLFLATKAGVAGTEGEYYFGLQYGYGNYDEDGISETFEPTLLIGRFGRFLTPVIAIEGRLGAGLDDDTHNLPEFGNRDATLEIDSMLGLFGTAHLNLTESSSIYGVLGMSKVKGTASLPSFPGLESTESNSSVSYGFGADIGIGSRWAVNIEYIRYLDKEDFDFDVGSVGASFNF